MTNRHLILYVLGLLVVLLLWHQVFVMTGVLWWNAPAPGQRLAALEPLDLQRPDTHLVDLDMYLAAHTEWRPR